MTGIQDNRLLAISEDPEDTAAILSDLKQVAIDTNKEWSNILGISHSAAITTVKPSGTVSQLTDSASGIHPRFSEYYIRSVRNSVRDPISSFLIEAGVPYELDVTNPSSYVFSFPMKSPEGAVCVKDTSAKEQLEHYLIFKKYWCEHNPSITIYVKEHEWMEIGALVYKHFDDIGGVSFLPESEHIYKQAPYIPIEKSEYDRLMEQFPEVDWSKFKEDQDNVESTKELACVAGYCEI